MVRAGNSPGAKGSLSVLAWLLPAVVTAGATVTAVLVVPATAEEAVALCGALATVLVGALTAETARRGRRISQLRRDNQELEADLTYRLAQQEAATSRMADKVLPDAVSRLQHGDFLSDILADADAANGPEGLTPEFRTAHQALLRSVLEAVAAEEDLRESAQRAFVNIARRVQAIVHQQAQDMRSMEDRHGDNPDVFRDLLHLDHGNALVGRLADSIAVLGGARPGRQWNRAVPLYSVLRGAMSRILDYQRVELHSVAEAAVLGPAVEPVIHALAELLDNATRYSPPQTKVHLTATQVQSGMAVEIEDGGVSLSEEARARAERMLAQAQAGIDVNDLGESPRLGLAVVGRLAQAYGFKVSLRSSAYGGVRAVLIVPQELITTNPANGPLAHGIGSVSGPRTDQPAEGRNRKNSERTFGRGVPMPRPTETQATQPAQAAPAQPPAQPETDPERTQDGVPVVTERTPGGLPQRRRRNRPAASPAASPATDSTATQEDSVQPGLWLAAFQSGVNGSASAPTATTSAADEANDATSDKGGNR